MQRAKKIIQSPVMLLVLMAIKLITYYSLIDVSLTRNFLVLSSICILLLIFFDFATCKIKYRSLLFLLIYGGFTILMFSDTMYFNYYNQTVSVKQLWQASNVAKVPKSFFATLIPASFILVFEVPFVFYYFRKYSQAWIEEYNITRKKVRRYRYVLVTLLLVVAVNPLGNRKLIKINSVEFFANHVNDVVSAVMKNTRASSVSEVEVMQEVNGVAGAEKESRNYQGLAKGKNLILIQVESLQNFVIGAKYNGQEITPNLNKLLGKDSFYFDHYYSNIGKGNTVDAEFSTLNSLYPVIDRECYSLYEQNTFNGLPWLMRENGYYSFAVHGYVGSFWNRENAYPYQGFEEFYSQEDLDDTEQIGLGISDKSMLKQAANIIVEQDKPYFAFLNTLTNHHPYELEESEYLLTLAEEDKGTMFGKYLETVAYTDAAIGEFIEDLKEKGVYENTVIALYGDHHGLNATMSENKQRVTEFLGKDYDYDEMFKVPLIIHVPGTGLKETVSMTGGQIDFLPTICNLFDIKIPQPYILGRDLLNSKEGIVAFTAYLFQGSFVKNNVMFEISREKLFEGSRAWNIDTGEELDIEPYEEDYKQTVKLKESSQYILEHDLMASMFDHNKTIQRQDDDPTATNYPEDTLN